MAIRRFIASEDTTITNALLEDLTTRATSSNMGMADSLEVFSVYGQVSGTAASLYPGAEGSSGYSTELSRILVKFPVTTSDDSQNSIQAKRTAGTIPTDGNVKFFLRLYNVAHHESLPVNFKMNVFAVSSSWQEGRGVDLDTYEDKTNNGVGVNWIDANNAFAAATATIKIVGSSASTIDDGSPPSFTLTSLDGTERTYAFQNGGSYANGASAGGTTVRWYGTDGSASTQGGMAALLKTAIEGSAGHNGKLTVALSTVTNTNDTLTITQATKGVGGNTAIPAVTNGNASDLTVNGAITATNFINGNGAWANVGGDYHTGSSAGVDNSAVMYSCAFPKGNEDLELDITTLVEQWIAGTKNNYGVGIFLTSSQEGYFSSATGKNLPAASGGIMHNVTGAQTSYYTKKFSARGSEYFFKRPCLEARWDSAKKDDRGNFYYSSSLAMAEENLNTLYFYNYFRGGLRNIPSLESPSDIFVKIYSGSTTSPSGDPVSLVADGVHVRSVCTTIVSGGFVSTGIYSASFALTPAATPLTTLYDVWFSGSNIYHTGTIKPKIISASPIAPDNRYVSKITNLRKQYRRSEGDARFRLYTRSKNWNPTIYTKATAQAQVDIIESGSYEVYRVIDDLKVISHGTGSTLHTQMSFDLSGSYFDLDMRLFESGYMYGLRLAYYNESVGSWVHQPETFKFRVED